MADTTEKAVRVTPWTGEQAPTQEAIRRKLAAEGLRPYQWSNGPYDTYSAHTHGYDKVIYVVSGTITFGLPRRGEAVALTVGDRLDLPAGVAHDAEVGPQGVVCLEAHKQQTAS